ncbi:hypothetical protein [Amycolatopsis nigrescens]|uniref:hypothetical protein n=1 Tax=Amycolatopsis nigrescens TaxID=381445 RepID=UPI00036A8CF2|nr:hypothetical protein [Amycolatopsis nigrescens]
MTFRYIGGGPYCYANSLAMMLGERAPGPDVLEVLTGSPFGLHFENGLPFFDAPGWDPEIGVDAALELLGWTCRRTTSGTAEQAIGWLRTATRDTPALAGPVEMGLLLQQPGSGAAIGADHYVVVLGIEGDLVRFHDPHGHPFATLPTDAFAAAWRTDSIGYPCEPFTLRTEFQRVTEVDVAAALHRSLPVAADRLTGCEANTLRLAALVSAGLDSVLRDHLVHFAIRVGTRRLADAAAALDGLGLHRAAAVLDEQARLVGGLQYPLVAGADEDATKLLRELAPSYERLRLELLQVVSNANVIR